MIENHPAFHYLGYIDGPRFVLYVFDEGLHVHAKGPVRMRRPLPNELPQAQAACMGVLMAEFDSLMAADVGWNPANANSCWGHVARAQAALKKFGLYSNPLESRAWADTIRRDAAPQDPVFCWNPTRQARTDLRIFNSPLVRVGDPHFDPAHGRPAVDALLAQAEPSLAQQVCEIAGAHEFRFKGYLPGEPGQAPTLVFDGGVWIPRHEDAAIVGFYPRGGTVDLNQTREDFNLETFRTGLADPAKLQQVLGSFRAGMAAYGARTPIAVLVDMIDPHHPVVRQLGKGYVPSESAGADPAIDDLAALRILLRAQYAPCKDPARATYGHEIDRLCHWDAQDAMAVIKAALYQRAERALPATSAHGVALPYIADFCTRQAGMEAVMLKTQCVTMPFAALLDNMRVDTRMAMSLKLRLDQAALLAWLTDLGFHQPTLSPFAKPAITREALTLRHALVRLHVKGQANDEHPAVVYVDHSGHVQLAGEQLDADVAAKRLNEQHDRLIDFIALV